MKCIGLPFFLPGHWTPGCSIKLFGDLGTTQIWKLVCGCFTKAGFYSRQLEAWGRGVRGFVFLWVNLVGFFLIWSKGWLIAWLDPCTLPACASFAMWVTGGDWCSSAALYPRPSLVAAGCQIALCTFSTAAVNLRRTVCHRKSRRVVPPLQRLTSFWWTPLALCPLQVEAPLSSLSKGIEQNLSDCMS